jgi:hypothetical protein
VYLIRSTDQGASWEVVTDIGEETDVAPGGNVHGSWDPLMYVDDITDTVHFDPMFPPLVCTDLQSSTDDGDSWTQHPPACHPPPMDHQKFFTALPGPDAPPQAGAAHDTVLYQCYNALRSTNCAVSYDNGYSWPVVEPVAEDISGNCGGINGFGEGSTEGVAAVPIQSGCQQATIAVTTDSGLCWELKKVPEQTGVAPFDPEVDFDTENNMYIVWRDSNEHTYLAKSPDYGDSWQGPWDITPPGVESTIFNTLSVADDGKLGISFYGSPDTDAGPDEAPEDARWNLYQLISDNENEPPAFTSYQVNDDEDPVQVGRICTGGVNCGEKLNLLEFIDGSIGPDGTYYTIYTDGCVEECAENPTGQASTASQVAWARLDGVALLDGDAQEEATPNATMGSSLAPAR